MKIAADADGAADYGPNCVRFQYTLGSMPGATTITTATGTTTALGQTLGTESYSANGTYYRWICHAVASETRYYEIDAGGVADTTCPVTCTNCSDADDALFGASPLAAINCTSGEPFRVTHPTYGTATPTGPTHADTDPYDDCDADASPSVVTSYAELTSTFSTLCSTAGTHKIVMTPGLHTTATELDFSGACTSTKICIEPNWSDVDLEPTPNTQIDFGHRDQMVVIRNTNPFRRLNYNSSGSALVKGGDDITIRGFVFEDVQTPQTPIQRTVSSFAFSSLTLGETCPASFVHDAAVSVSLGGGFFGTTSATIEGCTGSTLTLQSANWSGTPSTATATVGADTVNVSGYSNATLTLATTCPAEFQDSVAVMLNMPGTDAYTAIIEVASCSGTTLTPKSTTLAISGALSGNGYVTLGALPISTCSTSSPITCDYSGVTNALPTGNYTGYDRFYVELVNGQTGANGRWAWSVVDSDTFTITGSTSVGAFTSSPYAYARIDAGMALVTVDASNTANFHMAQVFVHPLDTGAAGLAPIVGLNNASGFIFRDGIVAGATRNCSIPAANDNSSCVVQPSRAGDAFRADAATDVQIINNLLYGIHGTAGLLNIQNNGKSPEDITVSRNHDIGTDRWIPDTGGTKYPGTFEMFSQMRHRIELKTGCYRCLISYNYFADFGFDSNNAQGILIALNNTWGFSPSGVYRGEDVEIAYNWADDSGTFFGTGQQLATSTNNMSYWRRISVHDNLIRGHAPRLGPVPGLTAENSGNQMSNRNGTEYWTYEFNTHIESEGLYGGGVFNYQGDKWPQCSVRGNVFTWHGGAGSGGNRYGPGLSDYDESTYLAEFDKICPSARNNFANLIIAGVEDPQDVAGDKDSELDAATKTSTEMNAAWATTGTFTGLNRGPTDASYSARWAAVFNSDGSTKSPYTAFGVQDMAALRRGVFGEVRSLDVTFCSGGESCPTPTLTFTFTAPTTTGCTVRLTDDAWTTASSLTDSGGSYSQGVSFSGIATGNYEAWIECANAKPLYWAKTL